MELQELCEQAGRNNKLVEISGILLLAGGRFLQVLEGPKEAVEDTFLRIVVDPRHENLSLISRRLTTRREFGSWDMALYDCLEDPEEFLAKMLILTHAAPGFIRAAVREMLPV